VIGVQFEVTNDKKLKKRQKRLDRLLRLLPTTLEVPQRQDTRAEVADEQKTEGKVANNMAARLEQAVQTFEKPRGQDFVSRGAEQVNTAPRECSSQGYEQSTNPLGPVGE
jgi:hypothetical protein